MAGFAEAKVYFDGSHYIAIPHTTRTTKRRIKPPEATITIDAEEIKDSVFSEPSISLESIEHIMDDEIVQNKEIKQSEPIKTKQITKKELFNELYLKYINLKKSKRKKQILKDMQEHFDGHTQ